MREKRNILFAGGLLIAALTVVSGCGQGLMQRAAVDHYVRGQTLAERGDVDAALDELAKAVKFDSSLSVAHTAAGDIHRKRRSYQLARRSYESACDANPYAFRPHYQLGVTYQFLAEAARTAEKAAGYLRQAANVYIRAIMLRPDDFDANINLSVCYCEMGKFELAEQYCRAAIRLRPQSAMAYSNLGVILDNQRRYYEAVKAYKASLEIDTDQAQVLVNLGCTYLRQGRVKMALNAFGIAVALDPKNDMAWEQIGTCHYTLKDFPKAREAYAKAVAVNRDNPVAHRGLGAVYMTQFVKDASRNRTDLRDKALEAWNLSLELDPRQPKLRELVAKYSPKYAGPDL